ncbi:hypothetical protein [Amycolatopsis sp. MJM2582]|uniref:hypothetical protein n=1 Tax=Amycolatopsis sp. MJM2582 TaxID=1427749 RepID=UPI000690AF5B|nr:hypothetical protein [Amycolatopsis sp. MJM2582]
MTEQALDDHLTRYLGHGRRETQVDGIEIWRHERPEFVSFVSHGFSSQPVTAVYSPEIVCYVEHGQDGAAAPLELGGPVSEHHCDLADGAAVAVLLDEQDAGQEFITDLKTPWQSTVAA